MASHGSESALTKSDIRLAQDIRASARYADAFRLLATAAGIALTLSGPALAQSDASTGANAGVAAIPAETFLNSMGIGIHYAQGVSAQSYVEPLKFLGVRNIRDDFGKPQGYVALRKQAGVKVVLISDPKSLDTTIEALKYLARDDALLAVEGPNEPNNFPIEYQGQKGGGIGQSADWTAVANFQRDLYAAVKGDSQLAKYPVFHTSEAGAQSPNVGLQFLTIPPNAGTTFPAGTKFADFANVHNYVIGTQKRFGDNQAWNAADPTLNATWDGLYVEYGKLWGRGYAGYDNADLITLPRVTTETGWDSQSDPGGERVQGTILLNTYLAQFKRGWSYTFVYMIRDGEGGSGHQGVFNADSTPKLAAQYIHNLTSILAGSEAIKAPQRLQYTLKNPSPTTHDLLLQTKPGEFALVVWGERVSGSETVSIELAKDARSVTILDPTVGTDPTARMTNARTIDLDISDHPVIVKIVN